jgi:hypothetical protein
MIGKYKINLHLLQYRPEKLAKDSLYYLLLKLVQIGRQTYEYVYLMQ